VVSVGFALAGGQGTVMTGTVLRGKVSVGDNIELPGLKLERKIKSMQMFHRPVEQACQVNMLLLCLVYRVNTAEPYCVY